MATLVAFAGCSHASLNGWQSNWPRVDVVDLIEATPGMKQLPRPPEGPQDAPPETIGGQLVTHRCTFKTWKYSEPCPPASYRYVRSDSATCHGEVDRAGTKAGTVNGQPAIVVPLLDGSTPFTPACGFVYTVVSGTWQFAGALLPSSEATRARGTIDVHVYDGNLETSTDGNPHAGPNIDPVYDHWYDVYSLDGTTLAKIRAFVSMTPSLTWPVAQGLLASTAGVSTSGPAGALPPDFYRVSSPNGDRIGLTGPSMIKQTALADGTQLAVVTFVGRSVDATPPASSFQLLYVFTGSSWRLLSPPLPDRSLGVGYEAHDGTIGACTFHGEGGVQYQRCDEDLIAGNELKVIQTGTDHAQGSF